MLLLDDANPECQLLRKFLMLEEGPAFHQTLEGGGSCNLVHSYAFQSKASTGSAKDTLLCQVATNELNAEGAIIVNCCAPNITAKKGSILYNIMSDQDIVAEEGQVMVAVTSESGESFV